MIQFTSSVGVAPGTTTVQSNPGGELSHDLGVCPPGYYGTEIMLPGRGVSGANQAMIPYATESQLRSLGALPRIRWDLLALSFGVAFAGVLGYSWFKSHK